MKLFVRMIVVCFFTFALAESSALLSPSALGHNQGSNFYAVFRNAHTLVRFEIPKKQPIHSFLNRLMSELKVSRSA